MKRYKIAHRYPGDLGCNEDPNGEWVLWDDVEELLSKLGHDNSLVGLYQRVKVIEDRMPKGETIGVEVPEKKKWTGVKATHIISIDLEAGDHNTIVTYTNKIASAIFHILKGQEAYGDKITSEQSSNIMFKEGDEE